MSEPVRWHALVDAEALRARASELVLDAAARAIRARGRFSVALAGGSTPSGVYALLRMAVTDWIAWQIYFGDERCLPRGDDGRNSTMAAKAWLDHVAVPGKQVRQIPAELGARRAAAAYAAELRLVGEFDLVLLGLGSDGHTSVPRGSAGRARCSSWSRESASAARFLAGALASRFRRARSDRRRASTCS